MFSILVFFEDTFTYSDAGNRSLWSLDHCAICCHHPACNGQSPRHKLINVQKNDGAERNTQLLTVKTLVWCYQKEAKCA